MLENILNVAQTDGLHTGSPYFIMNTVYTSMLSYSALILNNNRH